MIKLIKNGLARYVETDAEVESLKAQGYEAIEVAFEEDESDGKDKSKASGNK
ncbi:MAG: hypothetical protein RR423_07285 [Hydrogenoanaerobacterium sp.]